MSDSLHFQPSADSHKAPIRDHIPVFQGFDEVVVDVEYRRNAHLIAPVGLIDLEVTVPPRWVGQVPEGDTGRCGSVPIRSRH